MQENITTFVQQQLIWNVWVKLQYLQKKVHQRHEMQVSNSVIVISSIGDNRKHTETKSHIQADKSKV